MKIAARVSRRISGASVFFATLSNMGHPPASRRRQYYCDSKLSADVCQEQSRGRDMPGSLSPNPANRFHGLAQVYARCRPGYPAAAINFIMERCGLGNGSLVVDVGSGTGISARLFAERGMRVLGIEPNGEMRASAEAAAMPAGVAAPIYRDGTASATGLPDASADAVLAAQAFHWFEPEAALRGFRRILKLWGWAILLWNERDDRVPFTAASGAVMRTQAAYGAVQTARGHACLLPLS